jgi:hypothetical protein
MSACGDWELVCELGVNPVMRMLSYIAHLCGVLLLLQLQRHQRQHSFGFPVCEMVRLIMCALSTTFTICFSYFSYYGLPMGPIVGLRDLVMQSAPPLASLHTLTPDILHVGFALHAAPSCKSFAQLTSWNDSACVDGESALKCFGQLQMASSASCDECGK